MQVQSLEFHHFVTFSRSTFENHCIAIDEAHVHNLAIQSQQTQSIHTFNSPVTMRAAIIKTVERFQIFLSFQMTIRSAFLRN
jgi:hypothetical protein